MKPKATESYSSEPSEPAAEAQEQGSGMESTLADEIRRRAYEIYLDRGGEHGRDLEDWLHAEREHTLEQSKAGGE